jgi:hypothetical protein
MSSQADAQADLDAIAGRVTAGLLRQSHLMPPGRVAAALAEAARPLGVTGAQVYLADLQQRRDDAGRRRAGRNRLPIAAPTPVVRCGRSRP